MEKTSADVAAAAACGDADLVMVTGREARLLS